MNLRSKVLALCLAFALPLALAACAPSGDAAIDKSAASFEDQFLASNDVTIVNATAETLMVKVADVDGFDWEGARPDREPPQGFERKMIYPGTSLKRVLGPKTGFAHSGAPFTPVILNEYGIEIGRIALQELRARGPAMSFHAGWGLRGGSDMIADNSDSTVQAELISIRVTCDLTSGTIITVTPR
jgi:hypothetical protein